ncbi:hypothetical protein FBQ98_12725 [Gammaproteobacteria bacterium PRO6]|nr:hypothetical protein [Gammaproteobacteria bacterium PRO6]
MNTALENLNTVRSESAEGWADHAFKWHGAWEFDESDGSARCRWFVAFDRVGDETFLGVLTGYVGSGEFAYEEFVVIVRDGEIASCIVDNMDLVSDQEVDGQDILDENRRRTPCDFHEVFEMFNFGWGNDCQYLQPEAIGRFGIFVSEWGHDEGTILSGGNTDEPWIKDLLSRGYAGINAHPNVLYPNWSIAGYRQRQKRAQSLVDRMKTFREEVESTWEGEED